jgi:hypothetical protein
MDLAYYPEKAQGGRDVLAALALVARGAVLGAALLARACFVPVNYQPIGPDLPITWKLVV